MCKLDIEKEEERIGRKLRPYRILMPHDHEFQTFINEDVRRAAEAELGSDITISHRLIAREEILRSTKGKFFTAYLVWYAEITPPACSA